MPNTAVSYISFLLFCLIGHQGLTQVGECNCKSDLDFLQIKIKKIPAYKTNKEACDALYMKMEKQAALLDTGYNCFVLLNKYLLGLNDNHSNIYGTNKGATEDIRSDNNQFNAFKNSNAFHAYPKPNINLDSLKSALTVKPFEAIEGVYSIKENLTIGVYKKDNDYQAIVLKTENEIWVPGEIVYTMVPYGNNYLLCIGGNLSTKRMVAFTERIEDGTFLTMGFQKDTFITNFSLSTIYPDATYVRDEPSPDITYIKIGSFKSFHPTLGDAERFYKSLEGTLNKKNLIIDLRNNGGGGERNSGILYKIIKDYGKTNKIYVIINHRTASNAEQFAFKLSKFKNCLLFGDRTNGTVAYELEGNNYNLPCGSYIAVLTSKKHATYTAIESIGIEPNVKLNNNTDWLEQVVNYIQANN